MASRRFAVRVAKSVQEQEAGKCEMCHSVSPPFCLLGSFEADAEKEKNAALAAGYLSKARTRNGTRHRVELRILEASKGPPGAAGHLHPGIGASGSKELLPSPSFH